MTSDLIDHLLRVHSHEETDFRWSSLRRLVKKWVIGTNILDAGCGTGHMTLELLKEGHDVTAVDNSQNLINFTNELIDKEGFNADVIRLDLTESEVLGRDRFDTIICLDVLEHISDDRLALRNLHRILAKDGNLIISVPAIKYLYGLRDKKIGHYRRYDRRELIEELEESGFQVIEIRYWNFLGFLPFLLSEKVFHKNIYEGLRYSDRSLASNILNKMLNLWFSAVENNVKFPLGLSIIAICKKQNKKIK